MVLDMPLLQDTAVLLGQTAHVEPAEGPAGAHGLLHKPEQSRSRLHVRLFDGRV